MRGFLHIPIPWVSVESTAQLAQLITLDLAKIPNHPTNRYGLTLTELERLNIHAQWIKKAGVNALNELGGTQGGGILLDQGHLEPIQGVALDER